MFLLAAGLLCGAAVLGTLVWYYVKKNQVPKPMTPDRVQTDDPLEAAVVAAAFNSGRGVFGTVDPATGEFKMEYADGENKG